MFLLFLVSWIALAAAAGCPLGYTLEPNTDKCYRASTVMTSFFDAQYSCTQDGGNLASITSAFENSFVSSLLPTYGYYFIGLTRLVNANQWTWLDGTPVYYTNFYPNQVNNESCVAYSKTYNNWFIMSCNSNVGYVCSLTASNCPTCPYCNGTCTTARCDPGWTYFDQTRSCYRTLKIADWYTAEEDCQAAGAHLTSIHSTAENTFVTEISQDGIYANDIDQPYIGLRRIQSGAWIWSDGTPVNYTNWHADYPKATPYDCAYVFADDYSKGAKWQPYWVNRYCSDSHRAYVCKKPSY